MSLLTFTLLLLAFQTCQAQNSDAIVARVVGILVAFCCSFCCAFIYYYIKFSSEPVAVAAEPPPHQNLPGEVSSEYVQTVPQAAYDGRVQELTQASTMATEQLQNLQMKAKEQQSITQARLELLHAELQKAEAETQITQQKLLMKQHEEEQEKLRLQQLQAQQAEELLIQQQKQAEKELYEMQMRILAHKKAQEQMQVQMVSSSSASFGMQHSIPIPIPILTSLAPHEVNERQFADVSCSECCKSSACRCCTRRCCSSFCLLSASFLFFVVVILCISAVSAPWLQVYCSSGSYSSSYSYSSTADNAYAYRYYTLDGQSISYAYPSSSSSSSYSYSTSSTVTSSSVLLEYTNVANYLPNVDMSSVGSSVLSFVLASMFIELLAFFVVSIVLLPLSTLCCRRPCCKRGAISSKPTCGAARCRQWALTFLRLLTLIAILFTVLISIALSQWDSTIMNRLRSTSFPSECSFSSGGGYACAISAVVIALLAQIHVFVSGCCGSRWLYTGSTSIEANNGVNETSSPTMPQQGHHQQPITGQPIMVMQQQQQQQQQQYQQQFAPQQQIYSQQQMMVPTS